MSGSFIGENLLPSFKNQHRQVIAWRFDMSRRYQLHFGCFCKPVLLNSVRLPGTFIIFRIVCRLVMEGVCLWMG